MDPEALAHDNLVAGGRQITRVVFFCDDALCSACQCGVHTAPGRPKRRPSFRRGFPLPPALCHFHSTVVGSKIMAFCSKTQDYGGPGSRGPATSLTGRFAVLSPSRACAAAPTRRTSTSEAGGGTTGTCPQSGCDQDCHDHHGTLATPQLDVDVATSDASSRRGAWLATGGGPVPVGGGGGPGGQTPLALALARGRPSPSRPASSPPPPPPPAPGPPHTPHPEGSFRPGGEALSTVPTKLMCQTICRLGLRYPQPEAGTAGTDGLPVVPVVRARPGAVQPVQARASRPGRGDCSLRLTRSPADFPAPGRWLLSVLLLCILLCFSAMTLTAAQLACQPSTSRLYQLTTSSQTGAAKFTLHAAVHVVDIGTSRPTAKS